MIKRIVSLFVVFCLLLSLFCVTASASDIYEVDKSAVLMSSAPLSVLDSGISTAAVEPSDLDSYLKYGSYSVAQYLASLKYFFTGSSSPSFTGGSFLTLLRDVYEDFFYGNGYYLASTGNSSSAGGNNSIAEYLRNGFLGLSTNIKAVTSAIQSLDFIDYSSILSNIYSSVDGLESGLTSANTAIGGVTTAVNNVRTAVNNVVSGLSTVNTSVGNLDSHLSNYLTSGAGWNYLRADGSVVAGGTTDGLRISAYIISGFAGLRNYLDSQLAPIDGWYALDSTGVTTNVTSSWNFVRLLSYGLRGISANIKGSETDNIYTSTLYDNNNTSTTVNSTGLGPLLNTQLSSIGENLGHLAYIFASDDDIKLKQDSKPLVDATDSFFDDSDTKVKVSANNIGSLKNVAGDFLDIVDTGADVGDAVSIVTNANSFRWFTAQTAADLDSIGTATISDEESTYDRLHREFNEIYFPDRVGGGN